MKLSEKMKALSDSLMFPNQKLSIEIIGDLLPKVEQLENENKKLKQEKTAILNTLKTVNEIRNKLRAEKKELREMLKSISNISMGKIKVDIDILLNKIKE